MVPEIVGCVEAHVKYRPPAPQRRDAACRVPHFENQMAAVSSHNLDFDSSLFLSPAITDSHQQSSIRSPVKAKPVGAAAEQCPARPGTDQPRRWRDAVLVDFWKCTILNSGGVVNGFNLIRFSRRCHKLRLKNGVPKIAHHTDDGHRSLTTFARSLDFFTTKRECREGGRAKCQQISGPLEFFCSRSYVFSSSALPSAKLASRLPTRALNPPAHLRPVRLPPIPPSTWERRPVRPVMKTFITPGKKRRTGRPH